MDDEKKSNVCVSHRFGSHYSQKQCKNAERSMASWTCTDPGAIGNAARQR
jgi:hypothetical protein